MKPSRKTHKNRYSITHLSSETTATLPEYVPATTTTTTTTWQVPRHSHSQHAPGRTLVLDQEGLPSDQPPEYPDSADEADEETDSGLSETSVVYDRRHSKPGRPLLLPPHSPGAAGAAAAFIPATHSSRHYGKRMSLSTSPPDHYQNNYYTHPRSSHHRHRQFHNPNRPSLHQRRFRSAGVLPYPSPSDDPYLDSLLERSVHALEMSNTLLQSSIPTRTSASAHLKTPIVDDEDGEDGEEEEMVDKFEERTNGLTKRIHVHEERREQWVDDLEQIKRAVDGLFGVGTEGEEEDREGEDRWEGSSTGRERQKRWSPDETGMSCSLPTSSSASCTYNRRPSQPDLQETESLHAPRLTYSPHLHSRLVSPALGALTQYIAASSADSESLTFQPTLGPRVCVSASQSTASLHSAPVMPQVTDRLPEPTTPAYTMLASFVNRSPPGTSSTPASFTNPSVFGSFLPKLRPRASSSSDTEKPRRLLIDTLRVTTSPSERSHGRALRSPLIDLPHRPMTPPTEVSTGSSSSSSESLIAKRTVISLRKILDEQPARSKKKQKAPAFLPITPAPAPQATTSNATASVSRLFTKAIHTSSTRPPSPPKQSALKNGPGSRSSISATQQIQPSTSTTSSTPSTSTLSEVGPSSITKWADINWTKSGLKKAQRLGLLPEILSAGVAKAFGATQLMASEPTSATSSGRSTPKRISFAELPEVERPQGESSRFQEQQQARRKRRRGNGLSVAFGNNDDGADGMENGTSPPVGGGWWSGWLAGDGAALAGMGGGNAGMYVSRLEERVSRPWGGVERPGFGFDDWAV